MRSKPERLNLRLSTEELNTLKEACELLDISASDLFRETCIVTCRAVIARSKKSASVLLSGPHVSVLSASAETQARYLENRISLRESLDASKDKT